MAERRAFPFGRNPLSQGPGEDERGRCRVARERASDRLAGRRISSPWHDQRDSARRRHWPILRSSDWTAISGVTSRVRGPNPEQTTNFSPDVQIRRMGHAQPPVSCRATFASSSVHLRADVALCARRASRSVDHPRVRKPSRTRDPCHARALRHSVRCPGQTAPSQATKRPKQSVRPPRRAACSCHCSPPESASDTVRGELAALRFSASAASGTRRWPREKAGPAALGAASRRSSTRRAGAPRRPSHCPPLVSPAVMAVFTSTRSLQSAHSKSSTFAGVCQ